MTNRAATHSVRSGKVFSGQGLLARSMRLELMERRWMNEADKLAICARCKDARQKAGLTENEIAEMLDPPVTDRTIRNYESGRPPFKYLRQWADICGVGYDWLLRDGPAQPDGAERGVESVTDGELRAEIAEIRQTLERVESLLRQAVSQVR